MPESLFDRERAALARLRRLVKDRAGAEQAVAVAFKAAADEADREVQKARRMVASARKKAADEIDEAYQQAIADLGKRYAGRSAAAVKARKDALRVAEDRYSTLSETLETERKDRLWTTDSLAEAGEKEADTQLAKLKRVAEGGRKTIAATWLAVAPTLARVGVSEDAIRYPVDRLPSPTATDPEGKLELCLEETAAAAARVNAAPLAKLVGPRGVLGIAVVFAVFALGVGLATGPKTAAFVAAGVGFLVGGLTAKFGVTWLARKQVAERGAALGVYQAEAARTADTLDSHAAAAHTKQVAGIRRRAAEDRDRAEDAYRPKILAAEKQRDLDVTRAEAEHAERRDRIDADRDLEARTEEAKYAKRSAESNARFDAEADAAEQRFAAKMTACVAVQDRDFAALSAEWLAGTAEITATLKELVRAGAAFPDWAAVKAAPLPTAVPEGIRFGEYRVNLSAMPEGDPADARLTPPEPIDFAPPAFVPFPEKCSVVLKARDEGRPAAVKQMQAMMLRFLTGLPPGKVRFTILDPVGLGENFAAFMHLADYDEQLVGARIWTEAQQIDQRLTDTTEHMENVIQKYLRNQYRSIEDYNRAAGEVAEPYRVLVVANFPTNFSPEAARRLVSIMSSGPACGVCTLVSVDTKAALPRDFRLADLEQVAFNLHWKDGRFAPADPDLAAYPLTTDSPPDPATVAEIVRKVGQASKAAAKVEVPFEFIMPAGADVWAGSTAKGFDVPIGRAGATKRQMLTLGRGTAQHALVAGKTGSGKSTLLHALITNLALTYSPDEAELYLIDFKEGVEFKVYADAKLPHARVVAIQSEREFGLSVLQRLEAELKDRGDKFRTAGANDLAGYRAATGTVTPRILLIVDEFQQFFVEDDKLSQEAALLLDRLVRQGRAFGLHVLLGSQTLGGAYSLARSTIDQMAVRIALQCSDADAQLILSKDNTAARLLSRPGEAIYNDANGMVEGNDPFQVVWLAEEKRETLLADVAARAGGRYAPPLVFEGNTSADVTKNPRYAAARPSAEIKAPVVWLGDAIAIKDPTAAVFRPASGANLLLMGQDEETARAILTAAAAAISVQCPAPAAGRLLTLLDGTADDHEAADDLRNAASAAGFRSANVERYELAAALGELAAEVERRQSGETADRSPRFLVVQALHRFRELRRNEDDYGFGRKGDGPKPPPELFAGILRDGPAVGIHAVVWCDSLVNLNRTLDRQATREFGMKVLFQMSAADSSTLIDTPAASRLGRNRALFVQDEQERPEKFRPYGKPGIEWLRSLAAVRPAVPPPADEPALRPTESTA